jgi:hypothetical protein
MAGHRMAGLAWPVKAWPVAMAGQQMAGQNNIKTQKIQCGKNATQQLLVKKNIHAVVRHMSCYYSKFSACKSNTGTGIGLVIGILKTEKSLGNGNP